MSSLIMSIVMVAFRSSVLSIRGDSVITVKSSSVIILMIWMNYMTLYVQIQVSHTVQREIFAGAKFRRVASQPFRRKFCGS